MHAHSYLDIYDRKKSVVLELKNNKMAILLQYFIHWRWPTFLQSLLRHICPHYNMRTSRVALLLDNVFFMGTVTPNDKYLVICYFALEECGGAVFHEV